MTHYRIVSIVARALLQGCTLRAADLLITASHAIEARTQADGYALICGDAFEMADFCVCLVGGLASLKACRRAGFRNSGQAASGSAKEGGYAQGSEGNL